MPHKLPTDLFLWIDHERPASTFRDQDGVLRRHLIARQTVRVPLADLKRISEHADEADVTGHGDL